MIARLAGLEVDRAAEAADDLFAADLIAPERPPRFVHPLLRAAVYDGLPAASRQNLHRRAAEILASNAAEPEVVAAHLLRCEPSRSTNAVKWLRAAAPLALRRGAPATAVSYLNAPSPRTLTPRCGRPRRPSSQAPSTRLGTIPGQRTTCERR